MQHLSPRKPGPAPVLLATRQSALRPLGRLRPPLPGGDRPPPGAPAAARRPARIPRRSGPRVPRTELPTYTSGPCAPPRPGGGGGQDRARSLYQVGTPNCFIVSVQDYVGALFAMFVGNMVVQSWCIISRPLSSSPATSAHSSASVSPRGSTLITR